MRILKIVLLSLAGIVLAAIVAVVVLIKTFDVNRYKPRIIGGVKSVLARDVDFAGIRLDISWNLDVSLKITDLAVAEDGAFGGGDFLRIKEVSASLDVPALLFRKQLLIPAVNITEPHLTIIRNKDGAVNASGLVKQQPQQSGGGANAVSAAGGAAVLLPVSIPSFNITEGSVVYLDKSTQPPFSAAVNGLELKAAGVSLSAPFSFTAKACILSSGKNLRLQGKAAFDPVKGEFMISDAEGGLDLSAMDPGKIAALFPSPGSSFRPSVIKGSMDITLAKMTAGAGGLGVLDLEIVLTGGEAGIKDLLYPLEHASAAVKVTEADVTLKRFSAAAGEGKITASGTVKDYAAGQVFNIDAGVSGVKLQKFLVQEKMPVKTEGDVTAKIKLTGKGLAPDLLLSGLSGEADVSVLQASLKDINILRAALDKITVLPFLSKRLVAALPDKYRERFESKDTQLQKIELPARISGGRASAENTLVAGDDFVLAGKTEAGMDGSFSLEGQLEISAELSGLMVKAVRELEYLLNKDKQIILPLKLSGKAGAAKVDVDAGYIADRLLSGGAGSQLLDAVGKALGKDGVSGEDGTAQENSVADMVNSVIDSLLKNK